MKIFKCFFILVALLSACSPAAPATPSATSQAINTPASSTQPPAPTFTPLTSQTPTLTPSQTNTLPPSQTYTQTAMATPNWQATYEAIESSVMTATPAELSEIHASPDEKWRVELVQYGCVDVGAGEGVKNSYEQLHLVNTDDGKYSIITDQLQYCEGIGAAGLGFVYWSPNSQYLYYTDSAYSVPDGGNRAWYLSLFRYDVGNGMTIDLRWGPLSPDCVTMAYPDQQKLVLYLWNLDKGEVARIPSSLSPDSPWPGIYDIAWSPDGRYLVYIEAENSEGIGKAWITQLDTATIERRSIY
jgi:WD40 repeat protein